MIVDCFFVDSVAFAVTLDELNGFVYYCDTVDFIIRRATLKGENITDILDLGPNSKFPGHMLGRVCSILFLLVMDQCIVNYVIY